MKKEKNNKIDTLLKIAKLFNTVKFFCRDQESLA